jgi:Spy/CpxP family protein refolding chaperone
MKKLMILALAIGMAGAVSAQGVAVSATSTTPESKTERTERTEKRDGMTAEQRAEQMTKRQTEMLTLTPEQQKKAYAINLERAKEMENVKAERMETKEQARDAHAKSEKSFQSILTPEQQKIWNDKKENSQEKRNEMRQERSGDTKGGPNAPDAPKTSEAGKSCCAGKEEGKSCSDKKKEEKK